ncbi:SRPBCC family protein [Pedobacter sp. Du54]|uniref:SRPBCC family protein n=1 Tax=Pedobacter anseongensis TaxID=3133439 RepID=UPI0030A42FB1
MTANYTTTLLVDHSAQEVFDAINNVRGWWSEEIEGQTNKLGEEWEYHYQDVHRCKMRIIEFVPNQKVVWKVLDNYFSFTSDKEEWKNNTLVFEITEKGNQTQLQVTQIGLTPEYECYDICENAWNTYIQKSLRSLITTGVGQPNSKVNPQTEDEKRMAKSNFTTTLFVKQSPEEVFTAINNVRGWWQGDIEGNTTQLDDEFSYRMNDVHFSKQEIVELIPNEKITWLVKDSNLSFTRKTDEWTGTSISFEIAEINNKTQVRFTHVGLVPEIECYDGCSSAWEQLIQESLQSLITTGKGTKVFE